MNRRSAIRAVVGPLIAVLVVGAGTTAPSVPVAAEAAAAAMPVAPSLQATVPDPPPPPTTLGAFQPENEDTECLGLLERPGCGSKERGGWRQTLVFAVMLAGLAAVFGRIGYGIYRNRA